MRNRMLFVAFVGCVVLTPFYAVPMEVASSPRDDLDVRLLQIKDLEMYIERTAGIDFATIANNVRALDASQQNKLISTIQSLLTLMDTGLNQAATGLGTSRSVQSLSTILSTLGLTNNANLSNDEKTNYLKPYINTDVEATMITNPTQQTIVSLQDDAHNTAYHQIVMAVGKIIHDAITHRLTLSGIMLIHDPSAQKLLITPAPPQQQPKLTNTLVGSLGSISTGLSYFLDGADYVNDELLKLEQIPAGQAGALTVQERDYVEIAHKTLVVFITIISIASIILQFYSQFSGNAQTPVSTNGTVS